jgi:flagellum-specific peptidoglycan hydrolase FlgJ
LESIDKEMQRRIAAKLKEYASEPRYAKKLISPEMG